MTEVSSWQYSTIHDCICKVIETQTLWGDTTCRAWLPGPDSVVRIPAANLKPLEDAATGTPAGITYVAVAARVADALTRDVLLTGDLARNAFDRVMEVAEKQGRAVYDELTQIHRERLTRESDKGAYAFAARRRAVERIGLPQVRDPRLAILDREEREWHTQLDRGAKVIPEMVPLLLIRLDGGGAND